jgi:hypothetical protein
MTATRTKPGRIKDPPRGRVSIIESPRDLNVRYIELVYSTLSGQLNVLDESGSPVGGNVAGAAPGDAGATQLGIGTRSHFGGLLEQVTGQRVKLAAIEHGADAIVINQSVAVALGREVTPSSPMALARAAYEREAAKVGLLSLPSFDEWRKTFKPPEPDFGASTRALQELAELLDVAVVHVAPWGKKDPSHAAYQQRRVVLEPVDSVQRPATYADPDVEEANRLAADKPPPAAIPTKGHVVRASPTVLHQLNDDRTAHLEAQGGTLLWRVGKRGFARWAAGRANDTLGVVGPAEWVKAKIQGYQDHPVPGLDVLVVGDLGGLPVDVNDLAEHIGVLILQEITS